MKIFQGFFFKKKLLNSEKKNSTLQVIWLKLKDKVIFRYISEEISVVIVIRGGNRIWSHDWVFYIFHLKGYDIFCWHMDTSTNIYSYLAVVGSYISPPPSLIWIILVNSFLILFFLLPTSSKFNQPYLYVTIRNIFYS